MKPINFLEKLTLLKNVFDKISILGHSFKTELDTDDTEAPELVIVAQRSCVLRVDIMM